MKKVIEDIVERFPELTKKRRGVPYIGKRKDGLQFSFGVDKIASSYSLYSDELFDLQKKGVGVDNCTLDSGDPFRCELFKPIKKEIKRVNSKYAYYKYPRASGELQCRKKIIDFLKKKDFSNIDLNEDNIIFTLSTTHAYSLLMKLLVKPNDVILITAPNYGLFTLISERENYNAKFIELKEKDNFFLNPKAFEKRIIEINDELKIKYSNQKYIPRVTAFLNENPNNPTGKVMGKNESNLLKQIGKVCEKHNIFLIDDLVYKDISYDRENIALPVGNNERFFDYTISLYGLSKSFGGAGLRAGFIIANEIIIRGIKNLIFQEMDSLPLNIGYYCAGAYNNTKYRSKQYKLYFNKLIKKYKFNYELLSHLINGSEQKTIYDKYIKKICNIKYNRWDGIKGVELVKNLKPESGFFAIVDFTEIIKLLNLNKKTTEEDLLKFLYSNVGIKYIMGKSMLWSNPKQYVGRINYAEDLKIIIKTFVELKKFIDNSMKSTL